MIKAKKYNWNKYPLSITINLIYFNLLFHLYVDCTEFTGRKKKWNLFLSCTKKALVVINLPVNWLVSWRVSVSWILCQLLPCRELSHRVPPKFPNIFEYNFFSGLESYSLLGWILSLLTNNPQIGFWFTCLVQFQFTASWFLVRRMWIRWVPFL